MFLSVHLFFSKEFLNHTYMCHIRMKLYEFTTHYCLIILIMYFLIICIHAYEYLYCNCLELNTQILLQTFLTIYLQQNKKTALHIFYKSAFCQVKIFKCKCTCLTRTFSSYIQLSWYAYFDIKENLIAHTSYIQISNLFYLLLSYVIGYELLKPLYYQ